MFKQFEKIELDNGDLCLWKDGIGRTYPCPFAYPRPCGTWCIHFGEISRANGDPRLDYMLSLGCCGTLIMAKEVEVTNSVFDFHEQEQKKSKSFFDKIKSLCKGEE